MTLRLRCRVTRFRAAALYVITSHPYWRSDSSNAMYCKSAEKGPAGCASVLSAVFMACQSFSPVLRDAGDGVAAAPSSCKRSRSLPTWKSVAP